VLQLVLQLVWQLVWQQETGQQVTGLQQTGWLQDVAQVVAQHFGAGHCVGQESQQSLRR
jgi:hypothetical protein